MEIKQLQKIAKLIRYYVLTTTSRAGSGHPTSALSATDLMTGLMFGGTFRYDAENPAYRNNDRLIFSKGHASALLYALWAVAGKVTYEELLTFRKFGSPIEGHPTMEFPFTEAATGSLGQGLSVGVGMALCGKYLDKLPYRTFVLMGDSEMAEGSVWEAMQVAAHYKLDNLIGILDVNRLGQRGETMLGYDLRAYENRVAAFGWKPIVISGHDFGSVLKAYKSAVAGRGKPVMIIAKTVKGRGVSFLENKDGWHGKTLSPSELARALDELGGVNREIRCQVASPPKLNKPSVFKSKNFMTPLKVKYSPLKLEATRKAYGNALSRIVLKYRDMVVLDAEVSNSTYSEVFKERFPELFFEMYIAEQNMVGTALGMARRGRLPFVSTFSAFFSRAVDQIRMASYSGAHIVFCGSHAGVSIGADGVSQMGLEDLAIFRAIWNSVVLYPADAVSCEKLVEEAAKYHNIVYIRTTRKKTPVIYSESEQFMIGGSKILKQSARDKATIITAGITVHEALAAYEQLKKEGIKVRIIDAYCVKPLDAETVKKSARETGVVITVEDHYPQGGLGEAVARCVSSEGARVHVMAVTKLPKSGTSQELMDYEGISAAAIVKKVKDILGKK